MKCVGMILAGYRPELPQNNEGFCPAGMWDLIRDCWHQEPNRRPSARKVLQRLSSIPTTIEGQAIACIVDKPMKENKEKEKEII